MIELTVILSLAWGQRAVRTWWREYRSYCEGRESVVWDACVRPGGPQA